MSRFPWYTCHTSMFMYFEMHTNSTHLRPRICLPLCGAVRIDACFAQFRSALSWTKFVQKPCAVWKNAIDLPTLIGCMVVKTPRLFTLQNNSTPLLNVINCDVTELNFAYVFFVKLNYTLDTHMWDKTGIKSMFGKI